MPLRSPNAPSDDTLLQAFATVLVGYPTANTNIGINSSPVYIQQEGAMYDGAFPALLVQMGPQTRQRNSRSTFNGRTTMIAEIFDRWEETTQMFDQIRDTLSQDIERMAANIEDNEILAQNNTAYAVSVPDLSLSPYAGNISERGGSQYISRRLTVTFVLLPYDV